MSAAAELAQALGARRKGAGWMARCPCHDDHNPSLKIDEGRNGKALVKCFAGCSQEVVIAHLLREGIWSGGNGDARGKTSPRTKPATSEPDQPIVPIPDDAPPPPFRRVAKGRKYHSWTYLNSSGKPLMHTVRIDVGEGDKFFQPLSYWKSPGGRGKWRVKALPAPRSLYHLNLLVKKPDARVLLVEGEKTADAAGKLFKGRVAVTWSGGSGSVGHADWSVLHGRKVTIWPDADKGGAEAALSAATQCIGAGAAQVKIVQLPKDLPLKWDLADPVPDGLDIRALLKQAKPFPQIRQPERFDVISARDLMKLDLPETVFIVKGLITSGLNLLAGKPKVGKSWLGLDFALAVSTGGKALGRIECDPGGVLYLALEDTKRRLQTRLRMLLGERSPPAGLLITTEWPRFDEGGRDNLAEYFELHPDCRLAIIDTFVRVRGKPKRDGAVYADDYLQAGVLKKLADEYGVSILAIHHLRKASAEDPLDEVSGTTGLTGAPDTILILRRERSRADAVLFVVGRDLEEQESALAFDGSTGRWTLLGDAEDYRRSTERQAIIDLLREADTPMMPKEITDALGRKLGSAGYLLHKLRKEGDLVADEHGRYTVEGEL